MAHYPAVETTTRKEVPPVQQEPYRNYARFHSWCADHFGSIRNVRVFENCQFEHPNVSGHGARIFITRAHPAWNTWYLTGVTSGDTISPSLEQYLINLDSFKRKLYVFAYSEHSKLVESEYCHSSEQIDCPVNIYFSKRFYEWLDRTGWHLEK